MLKYQPQKIEPKWQSKWRQDSLYYTDLSNPKNKYYCLVELPYTSGVLHIGHWFTFSKGDILARFKKMQGYNVILPNGYDTFGLPAENAAIKNNMHPREWTMQNVKTMREQFERMGTMIDWTKSAITCDPSYYKWNQWIFLKMYERGIAYRGKTISNWCPSCQTVLADENVENNKCWRCGTQVEKKEIAQWFFKITEYADKLMWSEDADYDWPKYLKDAQNAWVGKSVGAEIDFAIDGSDEKLRVFTTRIDTIYGTTFLVVSPEHHLLKDIEDQKVKEYITAASKKSEQERKENKEKSGVFTGLYAINPFTKDKIPVWVSDYVLLNYGTGAIMAVPASDARDFEFAKKFDLEIKPVVIPQREYIDENADSYYQKRTNLNKELIKELATRGNKVNKKLMLMGGWATSAQVGRIIREHHDIDMIIMEEDVDWWKDQFKDLGLEISNMFPEGQNDKYYFQATKQDIHMDILAFKVDENGSVISLTGIEPKNLNAEFDEMFSEVELDGVPMWAVTPKFIYEWKKERQKEGGEIRWKEQADFLMLGFEPFTEEGVLINSGKYDGLKSSEAREVMLKDAVAAGFGEEKVNYHLHDWSISRQRYWGTPIPIIHCEDCGEVPVPYEQLPVVLPEDVDYRPLGDAPLSRAADWVNVKCPNCGQDAKREVETMDGFVDNSWYFYRYLDPDNSEEIFNRQIIKNWFPIEVYIGGGEHTYGHALYSRFFTKFFQDLGLVDFDEYTIKRVHHGVVLGPDGSRMSKSKGNVVDPDKQAQEYGADAVRVYLNFMGPYDIVAPWVPEGLNGAYRFLERVWNLSDKVISGQQPATRDQHMMHKTIQKVTHDYENLSFNTSIAALMEWLNYLSRKQHISKEEYETFLILLSPVAPHITEELWELLGESYSIHQQSWPKVNEKYLMEDQVNLAVQINGKLRDLISVSPDADEGSVVNKALGSAKIQKYVQNKDQIQKIIYIKSKILNIIL